MFSDFQFRTSLGSSNLFNYEYQRSDLRYHSRLMRLFNKQEIVGSSPAVGKKKIFCDFSEIVKRLT